MYDESYYFEQLDRFALINNQRAYDENLQNMSNSLDAYFLCNKFRIACEMVSRSGLLNEQYKAHFIESCLFEYESNQHRYITFPVLQIYYQTYQFLKQNTTEHYQILEQLLKVNSTLLSRSELKHFYTYLLNFCVRQINFGRSAYYENILQIYQILEKEGLLLQYGYLTQWSFINATTTGIRLKSFEWTERFIHQYKSALLPEERQNTVDYQLATLYFAKSDYAKTLQILQQVKFTDIFYQASARVIQLKVFYELEETEAFYSLVKAIQNLLRRKRNLSEYHRLCYVNFIKLTKSLFDLKLKPKYQIQRYHLKIHSQLSQTEPLTNKEWLWEKYNELK